MGNLRSIQECLQAYKKGEGSVVSNFDASAVYVLGNRVVDKKFGEKGKGCYRGIHLFIDRPSCLKYSSTGYIEDGITPIISSVITEQRDEDLLETSESFVQKFNHQTVQHIEYLVKRLYLTRPTPVNGIQWTNTVVKTY